MGFQKTAVTKMKSGVVGEVSHAGPTRATTVILDSKDEKNNVFGRAFTYKDESVESAQAGGDGAFCGIFINPKAYQLTDYNGALNGSIAEMLDMGEVFVEVTDAKSAKMRDKVYFTAVGELTTVEEGNTPVPNCEISRHTPSGETPNLCVIRLTN